MSYLSVSINPHRTIVFRCIGGVSLPKDERYEGNSHNQNIQ